MDDLDVDSVIARVGDIIIHAGEVLVAIAESRGLVAENLRGGAVEFELPRHGIERCLYIKALVQDRGDRQRAVRSKVIEPPVVNLGLKEDTAVLHSGIE